MTMIRALWQWRLALVLTAVSSIALAQGQAPAPLPVAADAPRHIAFDVVSVKPNKTMESHPGSMIRSDGFDAENIQPIWVMYWVFDCGSDRDPRRFSGLPSWVTSERFDIIAKVADADVPTWKKLHDSEKERMVREVLEDRFKLSFHRESHEQPVYALVVAKDGLKMTSVTVPEWDHAYGADGSIGLAQDGVRGGHASIKTLIAYLNGQKLGREVVDNTGLTGNYDFKLNFTPFPMNGAPDDATAPSGSPYPFIFAALQEQLGLKLEPAKGPVETIMIDHIERPSEN